MIRVLYWFTCQTSRQVLEKITVI